MRPSSSNHFLRLIAPSSLVCSILLSPIAYAASVPATPATKVGDTITDPNTGASVKVISLLTYKDAGLTTAEVADPNVVVYVVTETNKAVLAQTAVAAVIFKINPSTGNPELGADNKGILYQIKTTVLDPTTTLVTTANVYLKGQDPALPATVVTNQNASFAVPAPAPAPPPTPASTPALGSAGPVNLRWTGAGGSNGSDGAIVVAAEDGGDGSPGPTNTKTIQSPYGNITAIGVPGITIASIGGNGGNGGDSYVNLNGGGGDGGYAGSGGVVTLTNRVDITATGNNAHGILALSQSGKGGLGGDGVLALGGGGAGGESRNGNDVTVNNEGVISTNGQRAHGIVALSSGGTAGSGGSSYGLVGLGGSGAKAGNGATVVINNSKSIVTNGYASHGILAQSVGGTGGDGGVGGGLVAFGGDGSTGGTGGNVTVNLNTGSNIETKGDLSSGVVAQSIGGGGGDSGASGGIAAFGASGGSGNNAGTVLVTSAAGTAIKTDGNLSSGIIAQSIGGGGGTGGSTGGLVALGGTGSGGGSASTVTVQNGGSIITSGSFSRGIFAQSIGGGGGSAGNSGGLIALGGEGSAGGTSGKVIITNSGAITTDGKFSQGILAQSIAGGGGAGGDSGGLVSIGGKSSSGGASETVSVTNSGAIVTKNGSSDGIMAQSIGGGGGNAGSGAGVVAIGGSGASAVGGNANTVTVSNLGSIKSSGDNSRGIFAQAVGGGGGNGGAGTAGGIFVGFSLGGSGGAGGDGAEVSVLLDQSGALPALSQSAIETTGDRSVGILAQSVGGGGGSGGDSITATAGVYGSVSVAIGGDGAAGGKGGVVKLSGSGRVTTSGDMAHGVLLESVGGGGGNGGMSLAAALAVGDVGAAAVSVSLGGGAGAGGDGGTITVTDAAMTIRTDGVQSSGFIAQSIGGGGGSGGVAIAAAAAASAGASGALSVGLGGDGAAGGKGGNVSVELGGSVITSSSQSDGILIQSVGGGGGNGGMTVAGSLGVGAGAAGAISVGVGGSGSGGGNAGSVTADISSDVDTNGDGSDGIIVQAIGGGGGNGGLSIAAGAAGAGVGAGSVTLGIGGKGDTGGTGNLVTADYTGTVITRGENSTGILAQSVGGGGGNGGGAVSANLNGAGTGAGGIALGLGGSGKGGGDGGAAGLDLAIDLETTGSVTTYGKNSSAIVAQSIGGGGGNGGFSVAAVGSGAGVGAGSIAIGLGGGGGGGGNGKRVEAISHSTINTYSDNSGGFLAQSVGGGGGNGGFNVSAGAAGAGTGSGSVAVGLGGNGGTAGVGGAVVATSTGLITTRGANSSGFVAQSIGGGGGNGGFNVSGTISGAGTGSGAVSVGLGGGGAGGGNSGSVTATTSANVVTQGNASTGILAQSVGGGGGNGGFNVSATLSGAGTGSGAVGVGLGGNGGGGGTASTVDLTVTNNVSTGFKDAGTGITTGNDSAGVVAQSIGGGGGNGGFNVTVAGSAAGTGSGSVGVGIGGRGEGGGDGARVTSTMTGNIDTLGNNANGLLAQSVGGGGGNGGFNVTAAISAAGTGSGAIGVGIGGSSGTGGNSGAVTSALTGNVNTAGNNSTGVTAQSLGGGGGNGGFNVTGTISGAGTGSGGVSVGIGGAGGGGGISSTVTNTVTGNVTTIGNNSGGVLAQSVAGGGGNGGFNISGSISGAGTGSGAVSVGIGGSGGGGGDSAKVTNTVTGDVNTSGKFATGIIAQSIGGGGGNGGFAISGAISGAGKGSGGVSVGIGGSGDAGGNAGEVVNTVLGDVTTMDESSGGVLAQSLGGGGGNGGFSVSGAISLAKTGSGAVSVGLGGSGGGGGDAAKVTNKVTGDVSTAKLDSVGIAAQSIGGGGGNGGFNVSGAISAGGDGSGAVSVGLGGAGESGGNANDVINEVIGNVSTVGSGSTGILAQSIGGGGGNGGFNVSGAISASNKASGAVSVGIGGSGADGGDAGDVTNTVTGDVTTKGADSTAIMAQSLGGGGGNGGFNVSASVSLSKEKGGTLGIGIGGTGGKGGDAGDVTSTVTTGTLNKISTTGDNSAGVLAQSIGGGGGNGAINVTGSLNLTGKDGASIGVGLGGMGGDAGKAGNAAATITGNYSTTGKDSDGIVVQSLGGGGGNGGLNVTGSVSISTGGSSGQASVGIGGKGGKGGASGNATLVRTGDTSTTGSNSEAIIVQSLAGGGGNGGINITAGFTATKSDAASINVGIGGFGGDASNAGDVSATIIGNISASGLGDASAGAAPESLSGAVMAQSVGGGGGTGGMNITGGVTLTKSDGSGKVASIGIGGFGGDGGDAGNVDLAIRAPGADRVSIVANGNNRSGAIAQSLGGGGGVGGINISGGISTNSTLAFGMGGLGGAGGAAKNVTANIDSDIKVKGDGARGILAQSLGGGGGAGGINVSGTVNINSNDSTSVTFGLGGKGGTGDVSGDVTVTQKGSIEIDGKDGYGILAQSVAGGGGDGGLNVSANIANASADKSTNRIVAGVGGSAGTGAVAGDVVVNSTGMITINGPESTADKDADAEEQAKTIVFNSAGILAQSIGGGGGNGGMNITASAARNAGNTLQFGMGGDGGVGSNAGMVTVKRGYEATSTGELVSASTISTVGDYSSGIVAQSVGGGGGSGGMNFNFAINNESNPDDGKEYKAAIVSIGGSGANAGNADKVAVRQNGEIKTAGIFSHGIVAQSIGGGGGSSNLNLGAGALGDKTKGVNIGIGGGNGTAGNGANVDVDQIGKIHTTGDWSIGIKAQSIGGGGGSASTLNKYLDPILDVITGQLDGASIGVNIGRKGGSGGTGGDVTVKSASMILTDGDQSIGILAQSIGGGGGDSGTTTIGGDYTSQSGAYAGNLAIGLDGGEAAIGGKVTVTTSEEISTKGERAHAIFAQSLGGGGGMGGTVGDKLSLNTGDDENDTTSAAVNIGGDGGAGSYSQLVTVNNSANLFTVGDRSSGIWAQSIGGTGGMGGDYMQANIENVKSGKTSRSFALNVGGKGGTGAVGGEVAVTNTKFIETQGLQSYGIRAESIGGGGGDGGAVSQGTLLTGSGSKQSVNINVGGSGGEGGKGSLVTVVNEGAIHTKGLGAEGIRAISTGGGGGNAGVMLSTLLTATGAASQTQDVTMNYGGKGGTGGTGGNVNVQNNKTAVLGSGEIWTLGESAHGVFAQSLGGGGGNGSSIISMTGLRNIQDSFAVGLNFGGSGGSGNAAGTVTVGNSGLIVTEGKNAYGILAQSTGGGGGNGGLAISASSAFGQKAKTPLLSIGGSGGDGNNGGAVLVTNTGSISTTGAGSHGIVAQSIGGGGGNSGIGIAATSDVASLAISNLISLAAGAVGGGTGGIGGTVTVNQNGNIMVTGEGAQAIVAESINGGGGRLGFDLSGVTGMPGFSFKDAFKEEFGIGEDEEVIDPKIATRLGGVDVSQMNASKVTVTTTGNMNVSGNNSLGSFQQSLGGGGGSLFLKTRQVGADNAASSPIAALSPEGDLEMLSALSINPGFAPVAISYDVNMGGSNGVDNSGADISGSIQGNIESTGYNSVGLLAQTIGGGGGRSTIDITAEEGALVGPIVLGLGSTNGSNEAGGNIIHEQTGHIITIDDLSTAFILQSIGGGGGSASIVLHNDAAPLATRASRSSVDSITPLAALPAPLTITTLTLGAFGGSALHGGDIISNRTGDISTSGQNALGLVAQSIGGGGGEIRHSGTDAVNVEIGGKNGASGNGGKLTITNVGVVETTGEGSNAVFLQSIGGGGGAVFTGLDPSDVTVMLNSTNTGNGADIKLAQTGNVIASGADSIGVFAQSLGGGGGVVDRIFMDTAGGIGNSGGIELMLTGNVSAIGLNGTGVFAQSRGSGTQGNIDITLATDKMLSFGTAGTGVWMSGGAANSFINKGTVIGVDELLGWGVRGSGGNDVVSNEKNFVGQFDLGAGANSFTNEVGSLFIAGPQLLLGNAANMLTQSGIARPGDMNYSQRSDLTGSYTQTATGISFSELDFGSPNPNVDGGWVDQMYATGTGNLAGRMDIALLTPQLVPYGRFQKVLFHGDQGVTDNGMELTTAPSVVITYDLVYPTGNDAILDYNVDFSPEGLSKNLRQVGDYFNRIQAAGSSPALADTVIKLLYDPNMEIYRESLSMLSPDFYGEHQADFIRGSERFGDTLMEGGSFHFGQEGVNLWFDYQNADTNHGAYGDYKGVRHMTNSYTMGFEHQLHNEWILGAGLSIEDYDSSGYEGRWTADGETARYGVVAKRLFGATEFSGILSYSRNSIDSKRTGQVTSPYTTTVDRDLSAFTAMTRVAHNFVRDGIYCKPMLDFGLTYLQADAATESGAGATSLVLEDYQETKTWIRPAVEFGTDISLEGGHTLHAYGNLAYNLFLGQSHTDVKAGLLGAPEGIDPMDVPIDLGSIYSGSVGVDFILKNGVQFGIEYTKALGDNYDMDVLNLKVSTSF